VSNDDPLVRIQDLRKSFRGARALAGVSLELRRGEIVGLIGPNGGGKTTLLRQVVGLHLPDDGRCVTLGRVAAELGPEELARIGYVDQQSELLGWMRVDRHIDFVKAYYPRWNSALERAYLDRFDIPTDVRVSTLSPGVRQQLAVLLAVAFEPELLILDEPAAAMDPLARARFLDLLLELIQDQRRAIVISSHILSDIEKVVDRVVILRKGVVVRDASLDELREAYRRVRLHAIDGQVPETIALPGVVEMQRNGRQALLTVRGAGDDAIQDAARGAGCVAEIDPLPLDDIYRLELSAPADEVRR
jgi:ABC-2 type transport system ATP-binding protein